MLLYCLSKTLSWKTVCDYLVREFGSKLHQHRLIIAQRQEELSD